MNPQQYSTTYEVKADQAGKSLSQLQKETGLSFRPDVLGNQLGIDPNRPLTAGQYFQVSNLDPTYRGNSSESIALQSLFAAGPSPERRAVQPAISSLEASLPEISQKFAAEKTRLEGEKAPLKERYQLLLDELKSREKKQVGAAEIASAREFGKRGVPLSSGAYDQFLAGQVNPITDTYSGLIKGATLDATDAERKLQDLIAQLTPQEIESSRAVRNAIAQLEAGAGQSAIENAIRQIQFEEQKRQFDQQQALAQSKFDFEKTQTRVDEGSLKDNFLTLGEGSTLYNLLTGQPLYTAPKTYKSDSGSSSLPDLNQIFG